MLAILVVQNNKKSAILVVKNNKKNRPYWWCKTIKKSAILVVQNNKKSAILVVQPNPVGVELFFNANPFFRINKQIRSLVTWLKTFYLRTNASN